MLLIRNVSSTDRPLSEERYPSWGDIFAPGYAVRPSGCDRRRPQTGGGRLGSAIDDVQKQVFSGNLSASRRIYELLVAKQADAFIALQEIALTAHANLVAQQQICVSI
ncbi:hypothetical protein E3O42_09585 [Cryobacterium adonitolivorans]|uniref:Uncharacterized protein n=1 Tax=Cryobacterium adonitolivorans TaxID=1259189 RepID=A0A4R8W4T9_9MICO|nr:hypothetical protein [Cryobacterium adonitolivorans]TFC01616.1 hypothetical protein E3O42_09585 [Cryobacterium adonitolivorans]